MVSSRKTAFAGNPTVHDPVVELLLGSLPDAACEAELVDIRVGPFWTVVQTTRGTGMASTMSREAHPHASFPVADAGRLHERTPLELAAMTRSSSVTEAAIGLAAVNAMLPEPQGEIEEGNALEVILSHGQGGRVAVIGHFPFVDRLGPRCAELWVFERGTARQPGDHGAEDMPELLPRADVVAITATTLVNHTLSSVLSLVREHTFTLILGPSTPLAPVLFDLGVHVLCGSLVTDAEAVLREASQGAVTRQVRGVRRVNLRGGHVRG